MKNKFLLFQTAFALLLSFLVESPVLAQDCCVDGVYYEILSFEEKTAEVIGVDAAYVKEHDGKIDIKSVVVIDDDLTEEFTVVSIAELSIAGSGLTSVRIPNTVLSIGEGAFAGCTNLASAVIGDSVEEIGKYAFQATALKNIVIPDNVVAVGDEAFGDCVSLESVVIGESVKILGNSVCNNCSKLNSVEFKGSAESVGAWAFANCTGLTSIELPNSIKKIGVGAFDGCSNLVSVKLPNTLTTIESNSFQGCKNLRVADIPESVVSIGEAAFQQTNLQKVVIPDSTKEIGSYAFYECANMKSLVIGTSVEKIGAWAFSKCISLESVEYNAVDCDAEIAQGDYGIFFNSVNVSSLIIGENVKTIPDFLFQYNSKLECVRFPDKVTTIGSSFYNCSNLQKVEIGKSVTQIHYWAFCECQSIKKVINFSDISIKKGNIVAGGWLAMYADVVYEPKIKEGEWYYKDNDKTCLVLYDGDSQSVVVPSTVTHIGDEAFYDHPNLISLVVNTGVTHVGKDAFRDCWNLTKLILLPNSVPEGIEDALNYNVYGSRKIYVGNDNYVGAVYGTIKKYDYLSSYFEVGGLRYVPISPSERTCALIDCTYAPDVYDIMIDETVNYRGIDMRLLEVNPGILEHNNTIKTVNVNTSLDLPCDFANACGELQKVSLKGMNSIAANVFFSCQNLQEVYLDETIIDIGEQSFRGCSKLQKINIPSSITEIKWSTFWGCTSLTDIELPGGLKGIRGNAFAESGLQSIAIPASTTHIYLGAFSKTPLQKLEIKDGKDELYIERRAAGVGMFAGCPLKEVIVGRHLVYDTNSSSGYSPFYRNETLETVIMTDIPREVYTNEFYGCTALKNVTLGDGISKIGDYAFSGCTSLNRFAFGANVESIGNEAFSDCSNMTELYAEPETPPTCGIQALDDINKWNCTLYVPEASIAKYKNADQWKNFFFVEAGEFYNGIISVSEDHLLELHRDENGLRLCGTKCDMSIKVYSLDGKLVGSAKAVDGETTIPCVIKRGEIYIVKYGSKAIKVKFWESSKY